MTPQRALQAVGLLVVALVMAAPVRADTNLDELASRLADQPVTVSCQPPESLDGAAGFVWTSRNESNVVWVDSTIYLAGDVCGWVRLAINYRTANQRVRRFLTNPALGNDTFVGMSLLVLEHEAIHIRLQSQDEALVECVAVRNVWPLIRSLGLPHKTERLVYQAALAEHDAQQGEYRSRC